MALRAKHQYQIECTQEISKERILDLYTCYQACIGHKAVSFYLTLLAESQVRTTQREHTRLCRLASMDIRQIDHARVRCEQFGLIRTYVNQDETAYLYELNCPLSAKEFLSHDVFGRLYLSSVGAKDAALTSSMVYPGRTSNRNMKEISAAFDVSLMSSWDAEKEVEYSTVQKEAEVQYDKRKGFDTDQFLALSTNLTFPYQARTKENLQLISDLGALYGITEDRMRILVGHCVNNATSTLNEDMLRRMASYEKPEIKHEPKNKYDMPPVLFLENIQGGISVSQVDKRLLESLMREMHLSHEVINVLVEYVLSINENRLTRSFVESIASVWVRNKVTTVEEALKMAQNTPVKKPAVKPVRKASVPKYMEHSDSDSKISDEERNRLLSSLSQLEE